MWGSAQIGEYDDDHPSTAFDADTKGVTFGADIMPVDNVLLGVAVSYSMTDITSSFNAGGADVDSFTLAPYIGVLLNEQLGIETEISIDAAAGYSSVEYDQFRTAGGARITSETDAERWFFTSTLNASEGIGDLRLTGTLGLMFASEHTDGFVESNGVAVPTLRTDLGRWTLGVDAAYSTRYAVPFVNLFYDKDFDSEQPSAAGANQPSSEDDQFRLGFGVRLYNDNGLSGNVEVMKTLGRDNFDELGFSALLRADF